jgi:hypothetical protein
MKTLITEDFQYQFKKVKFDQSYSTETIKYPFQEFTNELEINLENRLAIVEELKRANQQENIKDN